MAQPQIIINQAGGLPITASLQIASDGPATLILSGSVWSPTADRLIGIAIEMDGQTVGDAVIFSNTPSVHRAVVSVHLPIELDKPWTGDPPMPPTYTFTLLPLNADTTSDSNDWYQVTLLA